MSGSRVRRDRGAEGARGRVGCRGAGVRSRSVQAASDFSLGEFPLVIVCEIRGGVGVRRGVKTTARCTTRDA